MPTSALIEKDTKRSSAPETGHAKNAANFAELITYVKSYGDAYNPSNASLSLSSLEALKREIDISINSVSIAEMDHKNAVADRQAAYEKMGKLATRVHNALAACASDKEVKIASSIVKKIKGGNKIKNKENEENPATHSTSQMGFDNRVKNFRDYCIFLRTIPEYRPNETELQIDSLNSYLDSLLALTDSVNNKWTGLDNARVHRNKVMYAPVTGALDITKTVKKYVKSLFGTKAQEYKRVSGLSFKKAK